MAMPTSKQTIDPEKAYIKSLTSMAGSDFAVVADTLSTTAPELSDLQCCQKIYEQIIQRFTGKQFTEAMAAAVAVERALKQLRSAPADIGIVETSKRSIQESYGILMPLDPGIAKKISDCVREQADDYDDTAEQASIGAWLLAFPSENG